jgi:hypothetical protein
MILFARTRFALESRANATLVIIKTEVVDRILQKPKIDQTLNVR